MAQRSITIHSQSKANKCKKKLLEISIKSQPNHCCVGVVVGRFVVDDVVVFVNNVLWLINVHLKVLKVAIEFLWWW